MIASMVFFCAAMTCEHEITPPIFVSSERCLAVSAMIAGIEGNRLMKKLRYSDTRYVIMCFDNDTKSVIDTFSTDEEIEKAVNDAVFGKSPH